MRSFPYPASEFWTESLNQVDDSEPVITALAKDEHHGCAAGLVTPSRLSHSVVLVGDAAQRAREPEFAESVL